MIHTITNELVDLSTPSTIEELGRLKSHASAAARIVEAIQSASITASLRPLKTPLIINLTNEFYERVSFDSYADLEHEFRNRLQGLI